MREKTYHLYLNEEERSQVIQSLIAQKASFWTPKIAAFPKKIPKNF